MIRGYMAMSADGYVADAEGGVDWLEAFADVDYGYEEFLDEIETVVMGRATYDQIEGFGLGWPYPGKPGIVVTSRPFASPFRGVSPWSEGVEALAEHLRAQAGDSWIVGGPTLQAGFLEAGGLDRLELFVLPVLLASGVPLLDMEIDPIDLRLEETEVFEKGIVRLDYRF